MVSLIGDLEDMKSLGANLVRIHLQYHQFMKGPEEVDQAAVDRLKYYVSRAEETGLYLDVTGLGSYRREDPGGYESMTGQERWATQALFWQNNAAAGGDSPAVFCFHLVNVTAVGARCGMGWIAG